MSDAFARLNDAVSHAASEIPEGLKAKVQAVINIDGFDLMRYLRGKYSIMGDCELLEASNDSAHTADITSVSESDVKFLNKLEIMEALTTGGVEIWRLRPLLLMAHLDGHLPRANYVVSVSW
jgi:hypothetical protein